MSQIEELLVQKKAYMLAQSPAYRLDCVLRGPLEEFLGGWGGEYGPLFRAYAARRRADELICCAAAYELGRSLAGREGRAEERAEEMFEGLFHRAVDGEEASRALERELRPTRDPLASFHWLYWLMTSELIHYEMYFFVAFGLRSVDGGPGTDTFLREWVEPGWDDGCDWCGALCAPET